MVIHLIALAVPEGGGGTGRVPEGPVKGGGVLGRVGHDWHRAVAVLIQLFPDCGHPAVHHIRGGHHIRPCLNLAQGDPRQILQGLVVVHVLPVQNAAVAVGGVLAHAHVADIVQVRHLPLGKAERALDDAVLAPGPGAALVLVVRDAEEHHAGHARVRHLSQCLGQPVQAVAVLARHGGDLFLYVLSLPHEHGIDQGRFVHPGLTHHFAQRGAGSQSSGSVRQFHHFTSLAAASITRHVFSISSCV